MDARDRNRCSVLCASIALILAARVLPACSTSEDVPRDATALRDVADATSPDADVVAMNDLTPTVDADIADADVRPADDVAPRDSGDDTIATPDADVPPESCAALDTVRDGYVEVPDAVSLRLANGSFTIEAWGYTTAHGGGCANELLSKRGPGTADGWHFYMPGLACIPTGYITLQLSGGHDPSIVSTRPTPLERWFHVAVTYDHTRRQAAMWLDGTAAGTATLDPPRATTAPLRIAHDTNAETPYPWNGYLAEVRISSVVRYDRAFSPSAALGSDASTIALWNFREATGAVLDASGNGHEGTLVGNAARTRHPPICR